MKTDTSFITIFFRFGASYEQGAETEENFSVRNQSYPEQNKVTAVKTLAEQLQCPFKFIKISKA